MYFDDDTLRKAAEKWLEISGPTVGTFGNNIEAVFMGAILFVHDKPVSIRQLSKYPFIRSRRNADRWVNKMVEAGVLEKTEGGVVVTELGKRTARYYFGTLLNLNQFIK